MLIYPIYPDYQNQNGLTYNPSARFDLNHMNGYWNYSGFSMSGPMKTIPPQYLTSLPI